MEAQVILSKFMEAWNNHDPDAIVALFSDDGQYIDKLENQVSNRGDIREMAARIFLTIPDVHFEVLKEYVNENHAIAEYIMRGTQSGPWMGGQPGFNKPIEAPGVDAIEIKEGKIHRLHSYFTMRVILKQLGYVYGPPTLKVE